jgi:dihydroflavonol-4-reductase
VRILITGASGFIGEAVARAAADAGHAVRAVARDQGRLRILDDAPVEQVPLPSLAAERLTPALDGIDVLVHTAAAYVYGREAAEQAVRDNPLLARDVLTAALDAGTPHVVDLSSAVVLKPHPDGPRQGVTDIESRRFGPTDPHWGDPYLRSKVLAEEVADEFRERGVGISTIHPTMVIGPRDRVPGTSGTLLRGLVVDRMVVNGALGWTDVRDLAEAIVRVAEGKPGQRAIVSVGMRRLRAMARLVDQVTGTHRRRVVLPRPMVRVLAQVNDRVGGRLAADVPPPASLEYMLTTGPIDGSSGREILGRPYRDLADSVRDALGWWADHGLLDPDAAGLARPVRSTFVAGTRPG